MQQPLLRNQADRFETRNPAQSSHDRCATLKRHLKLTRRVYRLILSGSIKGRNDTRLISREIVSLVESAVCCLEREDTPEEEDEDDEPAIREET